VLYQNHGGTLWRTHLVRPIRLAPTVQRNIPRDNVKKVSNRTFVPTCVLCKIGYYGSKYRDCPYLCNLIEQRWGINLSRKS
jgi:hypothetical protein